MSRQKNQKIFTITALTVLGMSLFWMSPVFAQNNLVVEFEETPLFDEANFLPGESITRWVKVTNNNSQTQRIAAEAINVNDPNRLGDALNLEIKEGGARLYNGALSQFFNAGEVFLSDLAGSETQTQYDFTVNFYSGANNTFQGKTLGFDILIGFQGTEGGLTPGGGSGGGGTLPPGLTIQNESIVEIGKISATINWTTNYFSTSQVIYAAENEDYKFDLTKTNYGYPHAFPDPEDSTKVTSHSVTISGLSPNTKYYFRCVSHSSLAVSQEHSFTTLSVIGEEEPAQISEEIEPGKEEEEEEVVVEGEIEEGVGEQEEEEKEPAFAEALAGKEEEIVEGEETGLGWLLAAISNLFRLENLWWLLLLLIIIIIILFLLSRKKKRKEE